MFLSCTSRVLDWFQACERVCIKQHEPAAPASLKLCWCQTEYDHWLQAIIAGHAGHCTPVTRHVQHLSLGQMLYQCMHRQRGQSLQGNLLLSSAATSLYVTMQQCFKCQICILFTTKIKLVSAVGTSQVYRHWAVRMMHLPMALQVGPLYAGKRCQCCACCAAYICYMLPVHERQMQTAVLLHQTKHATQSC